MLVSQSIAAFLKNQRQYPLLQWYLQYGTKLETQVKVAADGGHAVEGKKSTFTDGLNQWWNIRVPKKADSDPEFNDYQLNWPLELHAEAIGTTGWLWEARQSVGFGFDFDAIAGHAAGGKNNTREEIQRITDIAISLPYVSAFKSSGGAGLHLWVLLNGELPTANHNEHAAVARCLLGRMSSDANFDFNSRLDICGGNMWVWHRKATVENHGYELIKQGQTYDAALLSGWRDHIPVVSGKLSKSVVPTLEQEAMDIYDELSNTYTLVPLSDEHKALMNDLAQHNVVNIWDQDRKCLRTHTVGLKNAHTRLGMKGLFDTISKGANLADPNCFMYPRENGSWQVYRYPPGRAVAEAPMWSVSVNGSTTCYLNRDPDLDTACRAFGGLKNDKGVMKFEKADDFKQAADAIGLPIEIPDELKNRPATFQTAKDGRGKLQIAKLPDDGGISYEGFTTDKNSFNMSFDKPKEKTVDEERDYDNSIRYLQTIEREQAGWAVYQPGSKGAGDGWGSATAGNVKTVYQAHGLDKPQAEQLMGKNCQYPWTVVSIPFAEEYPGGRIWNRNSIQLSVQPISRDSENYAHPHWDSLLNHIGHSLNRYVKESAWCADNGIFTGADYLRCWIASVIRQPYNQLPYLFLFGPYNSGKSILHEAIALLINRGVMKADRSLTSTNDFTSELEKALIAVVEEKDLSTSPAAAAKIRDFVTARTVSIRKMRTDTYEVPNITHWIQCGNFLHYCCVLPDDVRIVVIHVGDPRNEGITPIPKGAFIELLTLERAAFLRTLMDLTLPEPKDRLGLEVVETHHKWAAEEINRDPLDTFLRDECHHIAGGHVSFAEFYRKFADTVLPEDRYRWGQDFVRKTLPPDLVVGVLNGVKCIGNLSWEPQESKAPLVIKQGQLVPDENGKVDKT